MLLANLVAASMQVTSTRKRSEKVAVLSACIARFAPDELAIGVAFLCGELRQGKIGVAYATVHATHDIRPLSGYGELTLIEVDDAFSRIANLSGRGSTAERRRVLESLFARAGADEQDFLRRLLVGELRQGALESLVVEAIARASGVDKALVRRAQMLAADIGAVARASLSEGPAGLRRFDVQVMRPVQPMLAQTAESVDQGLSRFGVAAVELKLDGARVQVHKLGDEVRVYTRRLNDVTDAVPEIVELVAALPAKELILDGETIALRPDGTPHPFQTTMRRFGRKLDVARIQAELPLSTFFFDCLLLDGASLIDVPGSERSRALAEALPPRHLVAKIVTGERTATADFLQDALARGHEGVMLKSLEAPYEAGSRGAGWLKVKHVHTLDLVVLAAEWGSGRRRGWLSNLHLGARDPRSGEFVMLGKTFKGMTDRTLEWQTQKLLELEVAREGHVVVVRPELVAEIAFNDVQASPHYPAGMALRFARLKGYRSDKGATDADTIDTVAAIHSHSKQT